LGVDEQILLLFELRYKGEIRAAAAKIQALAAQGKKDFKNEIWNDHC
jgi:hypothetical protein